MKILLSFLVVMLLTSIWLHREEKLLIAAVKSNEVALLCHLDTGLKKIDPNLILDFSDGVWFFTNGYSKTCELIDKD